VRLTQAHARAHAQTAGDGPDARYSNAPDTARYLVPGKPDYVGGLVVVNAERCASACAWEGGVDVQLYFCAGVGALTFIFTNTTHAQHYGQLWRWPHHHSTYPQFVYLEHALRAGAMPPEVGALVPDILETFGGAADPDATARFALGMTGANLGGCFFCWK
jgi:hypothetical protein